MVIIFEFYTSNYTLWNKKKKIKKRVELKPKIPDDYNKETQEISGT